MKSYAFSFFFPTQPGSRQNCTIRSQGTNMGIAFARAFRQLRKDPKYKGRKGLDTAKIGVTSFHEVTGLVGEESTHSLQAGG